jgi:hypothetical protein
VQEKWLPSHTSSSTSYCEQFVTDLQNYGKTEAGVQYLTSESTEVLISIDHLQDYNEAGPVYTVHLLRVFLFVIISVAFPLLSCSIQNCELYIKSWATGRMIGGSSPGRGWEFFSSPPRPERL